MANNPTVRVGFLGDASQLAREARRAQAALDGVGKHAHTTSTALGTAFGTVAGRGIAAIGAAAGRAVGSIGAMASTSIQAASDTAESWTKTQAVFGNHADGVKAWADDNTKNILLTKQAALEGAATFGNLFVALGLGQKPAAELSTSLVGLAADLSSFNNVGTDEALLALRSGLLGEAEPLRKFGVSLSAARIEAEALSLGLAKPVKNAAAITAAHNAVAAATAKVASVEKEHGAGTLAAAQARDGLARAEAALSKAMGGTKVELTAAQKAQAAYSIITKDTATALGDAERTQDGYANKTRILHKNIGDLSAQIGAKLLPHALRLTDAVSDLVVEFENGTGTGGRLREDLGNLADTARGLGEDLKPVLGVARWFIEHPDAFKAAAEGMVIYAAASKSAAIWNTRLAGANAINGVVAGLGGVSKNAPGAAKGLEKVAGAASLGMPQVLAWTGAIIGAVEALKYLKGMAESDTPNYVNSSGTSDFNAQNDPNSPMNTGIGAIGLGGKPLPPGVNARNRSAEDDDIRGVKSGRGRTAVVQSAARMVAAQKAATDLVTAGQKYQADQAEAAAKRKAAAAEALSKATDKLRDALQDRLDTAKGIRDSLISSNSIVRDGVSWTAKDLLARFTVTMGKVKRFQTAISTLVARGFDPTIVSQVAAAGVQGGLGTAVGLAHASSAQVRQINATQRAINAASGLAGDRVASQIPVNLTAKIILGNKELTVLAQEVSRQNVRAGRNGSRAA